MIDGGSNDGTQKILEENGVQYISEPDVGIYHAMSKGIALSSDSIVHILNADDIYHRSDIVERVMAKMRNESLDLCHGYVDQVSSNGRVVWRIGGDVDSSQLLKKMKVAHPSVFVRREVYERYGAFSPCFKIAGDYDWLLRIWDRISIGFLPEVVVDMELGGRSNSQIIRSNAECAAVRILHGENIYKAVIQFNIEIIKGVIARGARKLGVDNIDNF